MNKKSRASEEVTDVKLKVVFSETKFSFLQKKNTPKYEITF